MAIKLKNFLYNPFVKFLNISLLLASAIAIMYVIFQVATSNVSVFEPDYFSSNEFINNYGRLAHNAIEKETELISEETILASDLTQDIKNAQIQRIRLIDEHLENNPAFLYVLHNKKDDTMISNIRETPIERIVGMSTAIKFEYNATYYPVGSNMKEALSTNIHSGYFYSSSASAISKILEQINSVDDNDWVYYTAVMEDIGEEDVMFYEGKVAFEKFKAAQPIYLSVLGGAIIVFLSTLLLFFFITGRKMDDTVFVSGYDRIPHEVQLGITLLFAIPLVIYSQNDPYIQGFTTDWEQGLWIGLFLLIGIGGLIQLASMIRLIKSKKLGQNLIFYKIGRWIFIKLKAFFSIIKPPSLEDGYMWKFLMWIGLWIVGNLLCLFITLVVWPIGFILFILFNGFILRWLMQQAEGLRTIIGVVANRRLGQQDAFMEIEALPKSLRRFGDDIESMQEGLEAAVEERLKDEKMKTELITNVTHDLKNPLTSIISYIELLKGQEAMDEKTCKYIQVLDEKADRLKGLIEQLVEAAKASSGNVAVHIEEVDVIQLVRQLCGEYEEKLQERRLQCVLPDVNRQLMVKADPMILYRILDNLMSNVHKYAMEGTRVYLAIDNVADGTSISIKNISSEPLEMDVEDLSQRFVRGDSSRNTEGSGLGISIALSLARLLDSELKLMTDGDLFKATMVLKKA